jgi:hypothetical protein
LNLAVMGEGDELQWHYDQTDFVVSLAIQDADEGGDFDVVPRLRRVDDENYDEVAEVLAGRSDDVLTLAMTPGTLLIFEGRYSLHRVSPIKGSTWRHVGLLAYDTKSDTVSSELLREIRYGRTTPYATPHSRGRPERVRRGLRRLRRRGRAHQHRARREGWTSRDGVGDGPRYPP